MCQTTFQMQMFVHLFQTAASSVWGRGLDDMAVKWLLKAQVTKKVQLLHSDTLGNSLWSADILHL